MHYEGVGENGGSSEIEGAVPCSRSFDLPKTYMNKAIKSLD
jgi:hypothetical protein